MKKQMRGIYAVLPTAFDENYMVDLDGVKNIAQFTVDCGCHGIVTTVNGSEFYLLDEEERRLVVEAILKQVNGAVPVVVGVGARSMIQVEKLARHAQENGANAVITMPPYIVHVTWDDMLRYYDKLNKAVDIPIFVQNFTPPLGTPLNAEQIVDLSSRFENIRYVKEETERPQQVLTQTLKLMEKMETPPLDGLFSGLGGLMVIDEFLRGACGCMPACHFGDLFADLWNLLEANKIEEATTLFPPMLPALNFENVYPITTYNEVLKYRGVIKCANIRACNWAYYDEANYKELDRLMQPLKPLFRV